MWCKLGIKWFCRGSSHRRPCMYARHLHCPVMTSQWLSNEPPGSQSQSAQPSRLSESPKVSGMHWLQSRPVTKRLQSHSPLTMLQPWLSTVPRMLHEHSSHPSGFVSVKFQKPSLHRSQRRPFTCVLQWQAPGSRSLSGSGIESQIPSSRDPSGSQSHERQA